MAKKRVALYGMFLALALTLSFIESMIPIPFGVPGMKLGLCNLLVLLFLIKRSPKEAFFLNVSRIILVGFLFGNGFSIIYSLFGAACSFLCMWTLYKIQGFGTVTISVAGGVAHNIGQFLAAWCVMAGIGLFWYLPPLLVAGAVTGALMGMLAEEISPRLEGVLWKE